MSLLLLLKTVSGSVTTPSVREEIHNSVSGGTSVTCTTGAGTAVGDVLYCFHACDWGTLAAMTTPTGTAGTWTPETSADIGTNAIHQKLWSRTVTVGGVQTVTVPGQGLSEENYAHVYVVSGVGTINDGANGTTSGTGTSATAPSVSPTGSNNLLLCTWHSSSSVVNFTAPGGMTNLVEEETAGFTTYATARQVLSASGATGTRVATSSVSQTTYTGLSIAIKGVASGGTSINVAETGSSSEALSLVAATPLADAGSSAETLTATIAVALTDVASSNESLTVVATVPIADAGSATQSISIAASASLSDASSSTDTISVAATISLVDAGSAGDALTSGMPVALADGGSSTESLSVSATLSVADTGSSNEAVNVTATIALVDAATANESLASGSPVAINDTASSSEQVAVAATAPLADSASSTQTINANVTLNLSDTGQATESLVAIRLIALADSGASAESLSLSVALSFAEGALGADTLAVSAQLAMTDSATAVDTVQAQSPITPGVMQVGEGVSAQMNIMIVRSIGMQSGDGNGPSMGGG